MQVRPLHLSDSLKVSALIGLILISSANAQEHSAPEEVIGIEQMIRAAGSLR